MPSLPREAFARSRLEKYALTCCYLVKKGKPPSFAGMTLEVSPERGPAPRLFNFPS